MIHKDTHIFIQCNLLQGIVCIIVVLNNMRSNVQYKTRVFLKLWCTHFARKECVACEKGGNWMKRNEMTFWF